MNDSDRSAALSDPTLALSPSGARPVLYHFWRSSASWRVRWALAIKGVAFDRVAVDLMSGEQNQPEHRARSPIGSVPTLRIGDRYLTESVAIIHLLEELIPSPALLPADPWARARVRQAMEIVNSEIQPLQSPAVRNHARADEAGRDEWTRHFNARGLAALEQVVLAADAELGPGRFTVGNELTAADLFLVPQLHHARRFGVDVTRFPRLLGAEAAALATPHADGARPESQPDAPKKH